MKSAPSIAFDYSPSRALAIAMSFMTVAAVIAVFSSGLPGFVRGSIATALAIYGAHALYRHLKPDIVRVARGEGGWLLVDPQGAERLVSLVDHVQRGFLLVLSFRQGDGPIRRLVLTPDNSDAELRRRLLLNLAVGDKPPSLIASR